MKQEREKTELAGYLAHLAKLELSDEEKSRYSKEMSDIINYVDKISAVSVSSKPLTSTISGVSHVVREDVATGSDLADELLSAAPGKKGRFVKVPRIL